MLLASRAAIQTLAGRDDEVLRPEADRRQHRATVVMAWAVIVYWALTLPFVWWAPAHRRSDPRRCAVHRWAGGGGHRGH